MKNIKHILLVLGFSVSFMSANSCVGFTDVSATDSICEDLIFAKGSDWVNGYGDGTFQPNKEVNRAEFTKIVMNAITRQSLVGQNCFPNPITKEYEIKSTEWYSAYVCTAKNKGIVNGKGDGLFHPNDNVKYVEALKIILKALGFEAVEVLYSDWYTPYLTEANAMNLSIYPNEHLVTRGEMITLMREVYSKHTQRALVEKKWREMCHAKNYHFYKLGRTPTCEEKWAMQIYYEEGKRILFLGASFERQGISDTEKAKEIVDNLIDTVVASTEMYGILKSGASLQSMKNKMMVTISKNMPQIDKKTAMEQTVESVFDCALDTLKSGTPANKACATVGSKTLNDLLGTHSLYGVIQNLNNYNIAMAYLDDFYGYGRDNGLVALNEAKVSRYADMYETIDGYAKNSGYRNSWQWYDEYDVTVIVSLVEEVKKNVQDSLNICYVNRECLGQEQQSNPLTKFKIYTPTSSVLRIDY